MQDKSPPPPLTNAAFLPLLITLSPRRRKRSITILPSSLLASSKPVFSLPARPASGSFLLDYHFLSSSIKKSITFAAKMLNHLASVLYQRAAEETPVYELPGWSIAVFLADIVVFLPIIIFVGFALSLPLLRAFVCTFRDSAVSEHSLGGSPRSTSEIPPPHQSNRQFTTSIHYISPPRQCITASQHHSSPPRPPTTAP